MEGTLVTTLNMSKL